MDSDRAPALAAVFAAASASCLAYALYFGPDPLSNGGEVVAIAEDLARHGTFANPFVTLATGATATAVPLYPAFLAGLFRIFGTHYGRMAALIATIGIHGLHACLLLPVSRMLFGAARPGFYAAALAIALPAMRLTSAWDAPYTAAALMICFLLAARIVERCDAYRGGALTGVLAGLLLLLNPTAILAFAPCAAFLLITRGGHLRALRFLAAAAAALAITCLPWIWRNYRELGAPVLKDNFGMTLYASNNDCAESSLFRETTGNCYQPRFPASSAQEAALLVQMGEVPYDRRRADDALDWIGEHKARFAQLTAARVLDFWFPPWERGAYHWSVWLITILSGGGLWLAARRFRPAAVLCGAILLIYPLPFYAIVSDVRYRYPILWVSLLTAGYLVAAIDQPTEYDRRAQLKQ